MDWSRKCGEEAEAEAETASKQQTGRTKCTTDYNLACSLAPSVALSVSRITKALSFVEERVRLWVVATLPAYGACIYLFLLLLRFFSISFAVRALLF